MPDILPVVEPEKTSLEEKLEKPKKNKKPVNNRKKFDFKKAKARRKMEKKFQKINRRK